MGIVNRTLDVSQQKYSVAETVQASSTGVAYPVYTMPQVGNLLDAKSVAYGLSGTPTATVVVDRFIPGTGATTITIGGALTQVAFSTSGMQTFSLPALGSTLLSLQKGDVIKVLAGGTNAALVSQEVTLVIQATQDIKSWF